jgi:hypothetical protein
MDGVARGAIEAEGRVRGDATGVGLAVAAVAELEAVGLGDGLADDAALATGDALGDGFADDAALATGDALGDGLADDAALATGDALGDGFAVEVALAAGDALGDGFVVDVVLASGDALGDCLGVLTGEGLEAAGVGLTEAGVCAAVAAAVEAGAGELVVVAVSSGFTKRFDGAFGGGVASVWNFVRARSAAERSVMAVQPFSMLTSTTRSRTRRGRWNSRTSVMRGADTSSSSPSIRACSVSASRCQRRRRRWIGRGPLERSSS